MPALLDYDIDMFKSNVHNADKPETIDALKNNIRESIGEIQLQSIDNLLKNWTYRVRHGQTKQSFE